MTNWKERKEERKKGRKKERKKERKKAMNKKIIYEKKVLVMKITNIVKHIEGNIYKK